MALPTSGPLSLDDIHVEAGGATGTLCTINDADILALIGKTASTQMGFDEWYGASAVILLQGQDVQDVAVNNQTANLSDADPSNNNTEGPSLSTQFVFQNSTLTTCGFRATYSLTGTTFNRWVQATGSFTLTNLFSITGVDSSATGKSIYFESVNIERSRQTNGSDGSASVTSRWYQPNLSSAAVSSTRQAGGIDGQVDDSYTPTTFGGVISSANNGSTTIQLIDAVGLNYNSGSAFANDAKGMSHSMYWLNDFTTTQNVRIE